MPKTNRCYICGVSMSNLKLISHECRNEDLCMYQMDSKEFGDDKFICSICNNMMERVLMNKIMCSTEHDDCSIGGLREECEKDIRLMSKEPVSMALSQAKFLKKFRNALSKHTPFYHPDVISDIVLKRQSLGSFFAYFGSKEQYKPYEEVEKICSKITEDIMMSIKDPILDAFASCMLTKVRPVIEDQRVGMIPIMFASCTLIFLDASTYEEFNSIEFIIPCVYDHKYYEYLKIE